MSILIISGQSRFQLSYQHFFLKGLLIRKELAASLRTKLQTIYGVGKCDSGMGVSDYCLLQMCNLSAVPWWEQVTFDDVMMSALD
jgi:hypothetical protein